MFCYVTKFQNYGILKLFHIYFPSLLEKHSYKVKVWKKRRYKQKKGKYGKYGKPLKSLFF